jgi:tetratricopeptide (TPR) repeat protein
MKYVLLLVALLLSSVSYAQEENLKRHYEAYYNQMKKQGDVQGIINALTHLNVIEFNTQRQDTLAYLYMREGSHVQALNLLGVESTSQDSDLALEVKAIALRELNQGSRAIAHFEELFRRNPQPQTAYELADLKIQTGDLVGANLHITFGLENATDQMQRAYYESQTPYQVPMKASFLYLKSIVVFSENRDSNHDLAIDLLDEALTIAPNFNMATMAKTAIENQRPNKTSE